MIRGGEGGRIIGLVYTDCTLEEKWRSFSSFFSQIVEYSEFLHLVKRNHAL